MIDSILSCLGVQCHTFPRYPTLRKRELEFNMLQKVIQPKWTDVTDYLEVDS